MSHTVPYAPWVGFEISTTRCLAGELAAGPGLALQSRFQTPAIRPEALPSQFLSGPLSIASNVLVPDSPDLSQVS